MQVPRLSHLQFLVLGALRSGQRSGKDLRAELREMGTRKSGPAFYQLMARLEDDGLVEGWYDQQVVGGQILRERHYRITAAGRRAWLGSRDFYLTLIDRYGDEPLPA